MSLSHAAQPKTEGTAPVLASVRCKLCNAEKLPSDMQEYGRCVDCNPLRQRLCRLHDLPENWQKDMGEEERAQFYLDNKDKMSADLKTAVTNHIALKQSQTMQVDLQGTGFYMDEEDLRAKYANKPGYADKIMARAHSFVHKLTDACMYEDMQYSRIATNSTKREYSDESNMQQDSVAKKAKKPRKDNEDKENKENQGALENQPDQSKPKPAAKAPKPWTQSQEQQVVKVAKVYKDLFEELEELQKTSAGTAISEFMPKHLMSKLESLKIKIECEAAEVDVCMEAKTGVLKELKDQATTAKKNCKELSGRLEAAIEEATTAAEEAGKLPAADVASASD